MVTQKILVMVIGDFGLTVINPKPSDAISYKFFCPLFLETTPLDRREDDIESLNNQNLKHF